MTNKILVSEFEKLIMHISMDISNSKNVDTKRTNIFRLKQLENALKIIRKFPNEIKKGSDLCDIKGIGTGVRDRIDEILKTGKLSEIKQIDNDAINELTNIYGIGDKTAHDLIQEHNIRTVSELKTAVKNDTVKVNNNIIVGLKYSDTYKQHIPRSEMTKIKKYLQTESKKISANLKVTICGSYRRQQPFSNDIDCIVSHKSIKTRNDMVHKRNYFHELLLQLRKNGFIVDALTSDTVETKFMGFCNYSDDLPIRRIDIRYIAVESYYAALLYFTGSGDFNQIMRQYAKKIGYKLNEYGLWKVKIISDEKKYIQVKIISERDIFDKLELKYVTPKNRNDPDENTLVVSK